MFFLRDPNMLQTYKSSWFIFCKRFYLLQYSCYIEECKDKFLNAEERLEHCVRIHKLPKDFRFDQKPKLPKINKQKSKKKNTKRNDSCMDLDNDVKSEKKFTFSNNKQKSFTKYTGRVFTTDNESTSSTDVNMDNIIEELKDSLP